MVGRGRGGGSWLRPERHQERNDGAGEEAHGPGDVEQEDGDSHFLPRFRFLAALSFACNNATSCRIASST